MNETECAALVAGDTISDPQGILQVLFNDTTHKKVTVSLLHSKEGTMGYDSLSDASIISVGGGGGDGAPPSGDYVVKTGDTMTGPLAIVTATQPELHLADDAGIITFDLSNSKLRLADSAVGNYVDISLATVLLKGSGAAGASANKTTLGVNYLGLGHKTYQLGDVPISLSQSNFGELYIQLGAGPTLAFTDLVNGHAIKVSADAGNALVYGTDNQLFVAPPVVARATVKELVREVLRELLATP